MAADALPGNGGAKLSDDDEFPRGGAPLKYIPLCDLYSATSPCVTASGSKKVKAAVRKPPQTNGHGQLAKHPITLESQFGIVYSRRRKRAESTNFMKGLLLDAELEADGRGEGAVVKQRRVRNVELGSDCKSSEESDDPTSLSDDLDKTDCRYVRETRNACRIVNNSHVKKRKIDSSETVVKNSGARRMKKWVRLSFEGVDPDKFIELQCKVFWPLDASWYSGHITGYNYETRRHHLKYEDGEQEDLVLSKERIKFHISLKEMQSMELKLCEKSPEADELDANEMMVLAATLDDDCQEIETGDLIWAKLTGLSLSASGFALRHAVWPAIVLDESHVGKHKGLNKISGEKSVIVQFFGTYDFARVPRKQVIQFLKGLLTSCHSKCKKPTFVRGLEEAKVYSQAMDVLGMVVNSTAYLLCLDFGVNEMALVPVEPQYKEVHQQTGCSVLYLSEQRLPVKMQQLRDGVDGDVKDNRSGVNEDGADSGGESLSYDKILKKLDDLKSCKLEDGELQIVSLGKIVRDSSNFQNEKYIWPEGYTAVRKFTSLTDPTLHTMYEMEVLRDVDSRTKPLFKVKGDNGEESTPKTAPPCLMCWKYYDLPIRSTRPSTTKLTMMKQKTNKPRKGNEEQVTRAKRKMNKQKEGNDPVSFQRRSGLRPRHRHGHGPDVRGAEEEISNSRSVAKGSQLACKKMKNSSAGYRPVTVTWKDLDKCNVCHMDEEYENNLFLQCDKCRMMSKVHARCYGELEPSGGVLWLCNLCRPGAPVSPLCCLCPVVGGAMKPTADDCWAHLACAIWIPETCLSDIKKMEPIDGIDRINKDRWKLICSICHVSYGACIQCSDFNCRVSFHPLCARAAGFCLEPEDMDRVHAALLDEDEEDQSIQLLSFCQRHRPKSNENMLSDKRIVQKEDEHAEYIPPINPSGCARTEIYDYRKKRAKNGQDGPSSKRLYVENVPHIPGGFSHHMPLWNKMSSSEPGGSKHSVDLLELKNLQLKSSREFLSVADKYNHMKETYRRRLAYGKSRIHGFGVFTKLPYKAGDMVIEYTGEVIRGSVADRREHLSYDKLVGAGTYIFRVDDNRVLDATKAGSIAQFSSIGERLACHCGSSRCRGTVNDIESSFWRTMESGKSVEDVVVVAMAELEMLQFSKSSLTSAGIMANTATRSFLQVAVTEEATPPLRVVQIEGLVILKIIKHCKEFSPALVTGQLLGLDVGSVLEVTNCFPFPIREEDEEIEAEGANYQLEMMRCLREVNVDNNTVGWYQSTMFGSFQTVELIETFMNYQENIRRCVCIIYDPSRANQGVLALKALKLSDTFMELYRTNNFKGEKLREKNLSFVDIFEEIPIKVSNSALISAFMTELEADTPVTQCDYDRLQLSTSPVLERNVEFLIECMDDLSMEQQKFQFYYRNLSRQEAQKQAWLQKRRAENVSRKNAGEEPLPEEDHTNSIFKPIPEPSRLDSFLFAVWIAYLLFIALVLDIVAGQSFSRLYLMKALHEK
ncbi:hypothetical protein SASPL_116371 [Salvia splendens]|uniref:Eukaryotic translation initiation factor 3 subunit H n=1 Tax=Salvia splendens TaxID=180675 RepID=A0A8X8XVZ8_SALSN|nr:hypothetical protein SASPL_116371 [Salvia splendens]